MNVTWNTTVQLTAINSQRADTTHFFWQKKKKFLRGFFKKKKKNEVTKEMRDGESQLVALDVNAQALTVSE